VEPRQVFQSGANYRQHVIDLEVAHRSPDDPRTVEEARAEIAAIMELGMSTVHDRYNAALKQLRHALEKPCPTKTD